MEDILSFYEKMEKDNKDNLEYIVNNKLYDNFSEYFWDFCEYLDGSHLNFMIEFSNKGYLIKEKKSKEDDCSKTIYTIYFALFTVSKNDLAYDIITNGGICRNHCLYGIRNDVIFIEDGEDKGIGKKETELIYWLKHLISELSWGYSDLWEGTKDLIIAFIETGGCDLDFIDANGKTAMYYAETFGWSDISEKIQIESLLQKNRRWPAVIGAHP